MPRCSSGVLLEKTFGGLLVVRTKTTVVLSALSLVSLAFAHADSAATSIEDGSSITTAPSEITLTFTEAAELEFSTFKLYPLGVAATPVADEHAEGEDSHAGGEHVEGEHTDTEGHHEESEGGHEDSSTHAELDAAAEALVPEVIELENDEAQVAVAVQPADGQSETVTLTLQDELAPGAYVVMWRVLSVDSHTIEGFLTFTYVPLEHHAEGLTGELGRFFSRAKKTNAVNRANPTPTKGGVIHAQRE